MIQFYKDLVPFLSFVFLLCFYPQPFIIHAQENPPTENKDKKKAPRSDSKKGKAKVTENTEKPSLESPQESKKKKITDLLENLKKIPNNEVFPQEITLPKTTAGIIKLMLSRVSIVKTQVIEAIQADTNSILDKEKYLPIIETGIRQEDQKSGAPVFGSGESSEITTFLKFKKKTRTGTSIETELSNSRITEPNSGAAFTQISGVNRSDTTDTSILKVTIRQELLRDAFGYQSSRRKKIYKTQDDIVHKQIAQRIADVVVDAVSLYWNIDLAKKNVRINEILLKNIRNVLQVVREKIKVGLSESFEINQWKAIESTAKSSRLQSIFSVNKVKRDFLQLVNLSADTDILFPDVILERTFPKEIDIKADIDYAFAQRKDIQAYELSIQNLKKQIEINKNQMLPSFSLGGSYAFRGYDTQGGSSTSNIAAEFPRWSVDFLVSIPLDQSTAKVKLRNSLLDLEKARLELRDLERSIKDDIYTAYENLELHHANLQNSQESFTYTQRYYKKLSQNYRRGRYSAIIMKDALDNLKRTEQKLSQDLIAFNIKLIEYKVITYRFFEEIDLDIEEWIRSLKKDIKLDKRYLKNLNNKYSSQ